MGAIITSQSFATNDLITSATLNNILGSSSIGSSAIIGNTLSVTSGKLAVTSGGITSNELATNSVSTTAITDANVTPLKLSNSDFGAFTVASGVATLDDGIVTFQKIATAAVGTIAEVKAQTASKLVTADNVKQSPPAAKAYGSFTTSSSARTLSGSYNVSVTRLSTGTSQVTFTSPMATATYTVVVQNSCSGTNPETNITIGPLAYNKTTAGFKIVHVYEATDRAIDFVVFGTLA
jgi:hypothetical protein